MDRFDEEEDQEIDEIIQRLRNTLDHEESNFFDVYELEDAITYLMDTNDLPFCEKVIDYAIKTYPQDSYFQILRSRYFSIQFNFEEAQRVLDYVEKHFAPTPEFYLEKVSVAHFLHQEINAIELLEKAVSMDDRFFEGHLYLIQEYLVAGNKDEAVKHAVRAIGLDQYAADDLRPMLMETSLNQINPGVLVDFFKEMTDRFPLKAPLWNGLGVAYVMRSDFKNALDAFHFQTSLDPDDAFAYANIAEAYFGSGDYKQAVEYFKLANAKSENVQFNPQLGRCYIQLKEYDTAMEYLLKARNEHPLLEAYVVSDVVHILKIQGKFDDARAYLRDFLQKSPDDIFAIQDMIDLLNPVKDAEEIKELCYTAINAMEYNHIQFFDFIVQYCYLNECPDIALELCENYLDDPDLVHSIHYYIALLEIRKGQTSEAMEHLEEALIMANDRVEQVFLKVDRDLLNIPEVQSLLERYAPEALLQK